MMMLGRSTLYVDYILNERGIMQMVILSLSVVLLFSRHAEKLDVTNTRENCLSIKISAGNIHAFILTRAAMSI